MQIYVETYGCAANQNDSELMAGLLKTAGYDVTNNIELADIVIINTCIVKTTTANKLYFRIKTLEGSGKKLIIAGCMPAAELSKLRDITNAPVIGPDAVSEIAKVVAGLIKNKTFEAFDGKSKIGLPRISKSKVVFVQQISQGCMNECSFCETCLARGSLKSYNDNAIVKEIAGAKSAGFKEFWLTSQDNGCYGFDFDEKTNLAKLISKITQTVRGKYYLRIGMVNPQHVKKFLPQLLDVYDNENMFKFL
ncbi:MAG: MiaB/RimO family radical SAM methylthiotransferase, partial [Candidatus Aenigmatarchaeota archaeon]